MRQFMTTVAWAAVGVGVLVIGGAPRPLLTAQEPQAGADKAGPSAKSKVAKEDDKTSVWMRMKTENSRRVLHGLAMGDFDEIAANSKAMAFTGFFERWLRADTPEYKRQMMLFEMANQELGRQAKAKNLEGATLAFHQLTTSCVQCHKIVRDAK